MTKSLTKTQIKKINQEFWESLYRGEIRESLYRGETSHIDKSLSEHPWLKQMKMPMSNRDYAGFDLFNFVAKISIKKSFELMFKHDVPFDNEDPIEGKTPIQHLMYYSSFPQFTGDEIFKTIDLLIKKGARLDALSVYGSPVWAGQMNYDKFHFTKEVIKQGSPIDAGDSTRDQFGSAVSELANYPDEKNKEALSWLIDQGASLDFRLDTVSVMHHPLQRALRMHNFDSAQMILDAGMDINKKDGMGRSFLHYANSSEIVRWLAEKGANLNEKDERGKTPAAFWMDQCLGPKRADRADSKETDRLVAQALKSGANPNEKDFQQSSETLAERIAKDENFKESRVILNAVLAKNTVDELMDSIQKNNAFNPV